MTDLNDRLDQAIDALLQGHALPQDPALRELLAPGQLLLETPVPAPTQRTARRRLHAALEQRQRGAFAGLRLHLAGWLRPSRWAPVAVAMIALFVVYLSTFALPGQVLYPVKQTTEALGSLLVRSPESQVRYYARISERRLAEMEQLVDQGLSLIHI